MGIYENQRKIAIAVLVPFILILFLFLHFKIWSGNYIEGDLENVVVWHVESIKSGSTEAKEELQRLLDYACLSGTVISACLPYGCRTEICPACYYLGRSITLCSLSVRMND